jgi:hypothetical protein
MTLRNAFEDLATESTLQDVLNALGSGSFALRLDEVSATVSYVGEAAVGSSEAAAVWRIKKIDEASNDVSITWADGNDDFDNIWADRLILSYS